MAKMTMNVNAAKAHNFRKVRELRAKLDALEGNLGEVDYKQWHELQMIARELGDRCGQLCQLMNADPHSECMVQL